MKSFFADKYPALCGDDTFFYDEIDIQCGPGWKGLIDKLLSDLAAIPTGLDGVNITDVGSEAIGFMLEGDGFSPDQQDLIARAQIESRSICEICGSSPQNHHSSCTGCQLTKSGVNKMAPGWQRLASKIVYELEDLGKGPVIEIGSWLGYFYIGIDGYFPTEKQDRLIGLWNDTLRNYCEICGRNATDGRCEIHPHIPFSSQAQ